ncbi:two-component system sensor histidine kinase NtrB [Desulfopila inferna]|uniref:two-component system sensor histidine kinase NtrB n=1 Tax=Desulfopila inferna TaxID=468528 RepID=UPI0019646BE4|nr:ATP-binding protein [Desulfopila inferna]MBM9603806.1 PAS domain-containing protein [Desulfopila inferna]
MQSIPRSTHTFRFSRAAVGLLSATIVLGVILVFSTLQNISRAQSLMEKFLLDKGETIIRAIEAGSRATMMHHMGAGDPLDTLLAEFVKDRDIQYISIVDTDGTILKHAGSSADVTFSENEVDEIFSSSTSITKLNRAEGMYTLSALFEIDFRGSRMPMNSRYSQSSENEADKKILSIGLLTRQFDIARQQDVRHTMFMGAILFLVSSAGLYFLFLYQKIRITGTNLANMKLYTDNIIESIPVAVVTLDVDDNIVSCNRNTEELFASPLSSIKGTSIYTAFPKCPIYQQEACESLLEYETECPGVNGRQIPLRVSCSPLVNHENVKIGKVLIIRDMSSIKSMEIQLERSRRMAALGKMAAGIAHEIRNPLGTLRGFAQFFGSQSKSIEDSRKYSELMISEIDRLNQTVSGLLQFSRPRAPQFKKVEIDRLFEKTVSMMEADFSSKNVELQWQKDCGIDIRADPDLLLQVLMNLIKNSIKATPSGGAITLACAQEDHYIRITVADNGSGMSEEVRERMFDPFFTTTRAGTGLGLAVSHQIIEQHGGVFEVSTQPETGTSISILLPYDMEK